MTKLSIAAWRRSGTRRSRSGVLLASVLVALAAEDASAAARGCDDGRARTSVSCALYLNGVHHLGFFRPDRLPLVRFEGIRPRSTRRVWQPFAYHERPDVPSGYD